MTRILSSSFSQILNTNPETGNTIVEIAGGIGGSSDASAANQVAVQANPGADASKAIAVQGVTGGKSISVIDSLLQPATSRSTTTICLITPLVESSVVLSAVKILELDSRTNTSFRFSFVSGNTINTQDFSTVRSGNQEYQDNINFTGTLYLSAESLPTPVTIAACSTTNGSPTVSSVNSFSAAVIGQSVSGTGIPANTFIIRRAADGLSITLGDSTGAVVNATATGSVTLTFSGAVIRISRWT